MITGPYDSNSTSPTGVEHAWKGRIVRACCFFLFYHGGQWPCSKSSAKTRQTEAVLCVACNTSESEVLIIILLIMLCHLVLLQSHLQIAIYCLDYEQVEEYEIRFHKQMTMPTLSNLHCRFYRQTFINLDAE